MKHLMPQYEMGLGFPPVAPVGKPVGRAKRVVSIAKPVRFDEMPDEVRYQEWLRDRAWMTEVLQQY